MYFQKQNILFIHIPKTAGESITRFFLNLEGLTWDDKHKYFLVANQNPLSGPPQAAHFTIDEYYKNQGIPVDSAIKFTVVRNPWARLWSEYNYYWKHKCSWDEFFDIFPDGCIDNYETGQDYGRHIMPQVNFINDQVEILRFENLQYDFAVFCMKHNIADNAVLEKHNQTDAGLYYGQYDKKKDAAVRKYYKQDIEIFNYEFGQ